jgi:hypothetical protein
MRCGQCGDTIVGKPGYESTTTKRGWCGSPTRTRRWVVCQDCNSAGEYAQHLYRLRLQAELAAEIDRFKPEQASLF